MTERLCECAQRWKPGSWGCWGCRQLSRRGTLWDDLPLFTKLCFPLKGKSSGLLTPQHAACLTLVIQSHGWPLSSLLTLTPSSQGQPDFSLAAYALSHNSVSRASEFPLAELFWACIGDMFACNPWLPATSFSVYSLNQKQVLATIIIPILSVRGCDKVSHLRLVSALPLSSPILTAAGSAAQLLSIRLSDVFST